MAQLALFPPRCNTSKRPTLARILKLVCLAMDQCVQAEGEAAPNSYARKRLPKLRTQLGEVAHGVMLLEKLAG